MAIEFTFTIMIQNLSYLIKKQTGIVKHLISLQFINHIELVVTELLI